MARGWAVTLEHYAKVSFSTTVTNVPFNPMLRWDQLPAEAAGEVFGAAGFAGLIDQRGKRLLRKLIDWDALPELAGGYWGVRPDPIHGRQTELYRLGRYQDGDLLLVIPVDLDGVAGPVESQTVGKKVPDLQGDPLEMAQLQ